MAPAPEFSTELGGAFVLAAPDGTTITDQSLAGAPFVLVFGYTRCGPPCDQRLAKLAGWRRSLGPRGEGLRIVLVSVDPAHDTPQRIGAFARRIDPEILALTGSAPAIAEVTRAYNAMHFVAPLCGGDYTIIHSGAAFVMGADGRAEAIIREDEAASSAIAKLTQAVSA
jgi:protein SCO1